MAWELTKLQNQHTSLTGEKQHQPVAHTRWVNPPTQTYDISVHATQTSSPIPMIMHKEYGQQRHCCNPNEALKTSTAVRNSRTRRGQQKPVPNIVAKVTLATNYSTHNVCCISIV